MPPFTTKDANKHKKGMNAKQARQWAHIANSEYSKCTKSGGDPGKCEGKAIQYASGVIKKQQEERYQRDYGDKARGEEFEELGDDLKSYIDTAIAEWTKPKEEPVEEVETEEVEETEICQECDEMKNKKLKELAVALGEFDHEVRKYEQMVYDTFRAQFKSPDPENGPWLYTAGLFLEHPKFGNGVIAELNGLYWLAPFEVDENDIVTFSGVEDWKQIRQIWDFVEEKPAMPVKETAKEETTIETQELGEVEIKESDEPMADIKINEAFSGNENYSTFVVNETEYKEKSGEDRRKPLQMEIEIIQPGFGNSHDNNFYPKEMLALPKVAKALEGVKMYTTDHRDNEKSERTEVAVINKVTRYTSSGAPVGEVTVFDPDFAEKTRNRAEAQKLHTLECSIAARGKSVKGEVNGKKANIVKEIDEFFSVDFVTRAGAGGKTVGLLESETKEVEPVDKKPEDVKPEEKEAEVKETDASTEPVVIKEQDKPQESPKLSKEKAAELVNASKLPTESKERLLEMEYQDEAKLNEVITKEIDYVVKLTKSGKPFESVSSQTKEAEIKPHEARIAELGDRYGVTFGITKEV